MGSGAAGGLVLSLSKGRLCKRRRRTIITSDDGLAALSQQAHQLAVAGDEVSLAAVEAQVDEAARELWGITDREMKEIRRSLEKLG